MKFLKYIIVLVFSIAFVACENELDLEPQQSVSTGVATATADNVEAILLGAYDLARGNANTNGNNFGGDLANIAVLFGNTDQVDWNGTFDNLRDVYFKQMVDNNGSALSLYSDSYLVIGALNTALANLDKFEDPDRKDKVEGEAKFMRGLIYFEMVRLFGQQYSAGGGNTQLGVPIVLDPPTIEGRQIPRNTVEEVYTQVISDLNDAYNKLPTNNGNRADKYAAKAILARVYLQQGNYGAARDAADDVLQNSGHSLMPNFNAVFDTDDNSAETLFSWIVTTQEGSNWQVIHFATEDLGGRDGDISITQSYLDKFDSDLDERRNYNYLSDTDLLLSFKHARQYANTQQVRIAEMHLIRIECNFREGTSVGLDPLVEINTLRARSSAPDLGALTLNLVLNERELELGFEGHVLHDYKRTQRNIGGLPYDDNNLIFPIPQSAIDRNPILEQNPGY